MGMYYLLVINKRIHNVIQIWKALFSVNKDFSFELFLSYPSHYFPIFFNSQGQ